MSKMDMPTKLNGSHKPTNIPKNVKTILKGKIISNTNILHSTNSTNRDVSNFTSLPKYQFDALNNDSKLKRKELSGFNHTATSKSSVLRRSRSAEDLISTSANLILKRFMEEKENCPIPNKVLKHLPVGTKTQYHHMSIAAPSSFKSEPPLKQIGNKTATIRSTGGALTKMNILPTKNQNKPPVLRRSRSVGDLISTSRTLILKRIMDEKENCSIPNKVLKTLPTGAKPNSHHMSIATASSLKSGASLKRIGNKTNTVTSRGGALAKVISNINVKETKSNLNKLPGKIQSNKTTVPKPAGKKIPAYDYKARFNDLMEKHKILKAKYDDAQEDLGNFETISDQYEECQNELIQSKEELRNIKVQLECLQTQNQSQEIKITSLTDGLKKTNDDYEKLKKEYADLLPKYTETEARNIELKQENDELSVNVQYLVSELEGCKDLLFRSNTERKELHNAVMDLRGNIRVFCRVRPALSSEEGRLLCTWNYLDESTVEILNADFLTNGAKNKASSHTFSFDHVFHQRSTQEDIFELVSPLLQSALDGYNVCIFAYGQTGSGKTFTMDGDSDNFGVVPRTVDLLFESIKNYKRLGWVYEIRVSFLEIYNEVLYDLLSNEQKDMEIRISPKNKNDIYVSNLTEEIVTEASRLRQLMQIAKMNRATAATAGNERSSRSHAVTKIELIGVHEDRNEISIGKINLVDLAGSESPKTSTRMNETKSINRSLSELTNVILALTQKQDHIPYRNSKLTHLLMPSLGGNSKTLMFINVAPFQDCFVESVKSLRFASSVNSCKVAKAKKNKFLNTSNSNLP